MMACDIPGSHGLLWSLLCDYRRKLLKINQSRQGCLKSVPSVWFPTGVSHSTIQSVVQILTKAAKTRERRLVKKPLGSKNASRAPKIIGKWKERNERSVGRKWPGHSSYDFSYIPTLTLSPLQ